MVDFTHLTADDIPDWVWPTNNKLEIPALDLNMQATELIAPVATWGTFKRGAEMRGTWHFYTDDERFSALYNDPSPLLNSKCMVAVEPNYSAYGQTPTAVAIWYTYQKRWLNRLFQRFGIKTLIDLNVHPRHQYVNLAGVVKGWRAFATRGYGERIAEIESEYQLAEKTAGTTDLFFVVVGGGQQVAEVCRAKGWLYVPEHMDINGKDARRRATVSNAEG